MKRLLLLNGGLSAALLANIREAGFDVVEVQEAAPKSVAPHLNDAACVFEIKATPQLADVHLDRLAQEPWRKSGWRFKHQKHHRK